MAEEEKKENTQSENKIDLKKFFSSKNGKIIIAVLVIGLILILAMKCLNMVNNTSGCYGYLDAFPKKNLPNALVYANNNTDVIIYEFADFQCPYCEIWDYNYYPELESKYISKGKVNFAWINFPLYQIHQYANITSLYGYCIAKNYGYEGFMKYANKLYGIGGPSVVLRGGFNVSKEWYNWVILDSTQQVEEYLKNVTMQLGFDLNRIESCVNDPQTFNSVYSEYELAQYYGITGTPGFIIAIKSSLLNPDKINAIRDVLSLASPSIFVTPDKSYVLVVFAGALPYQYFEQVLSIVGIRS